MMRHVKKLAALVLMGALVVGCSSTGSSGPGARGGLLSIENHFDKSKIDPRFTATLKGTIGITLCTKDKCGDSIVGLVQAKPVTADVATALTQNTPEGVDVLERTFDIAAALKSGSKQKLRRVGSPIYSSYQGAPSVEMNLESEKNGVVTPAYMIIIVDGTKTYQIVAVAKTQMLTQSAAKNLANAWRP